MTILGHHYIGGRRSASASNNPLFNLDAVTGERHPVSFFEAPGTEVAAVRAAQIGVATS